MADVYPESRKRGLVLWKKGQSGNEAGRKKGLTTLIREALERDEVGGVKCPGGRTVAEVLAEAILGHAIKGNAPYMTQVMDRIEGKISPSPPDAGEDRGGLRPVFEIILNDRDRPAAVQPPASTKAVP